MRYIFVLYMFKWTKWRTCNLYIGRTKCSLLKNICNIMFILFVYIFPSTLWNCWRASQNYVAFLLYVSTRYFFSSVFCSCFPFTTATVSNCSLLQKLLFFCLFVCFLAEDYCMFEIIGAVGKINIIFIGWWHTHQ